MNRTVLTLAGLALAYVLGTLSSSHVHADPSPALDRQLTERMVRALEAQALATRDLIRATERCNK
jgi:hypothetical protein